MSVLCEHGHAVGETGGVGNDLFGGFVSGDLPAIVNVHIFVAFGSKP